MAQHRCATSSGQDSAVHLHLKESGHFFEDSQVRVLEREDHWFERGVKEAIHVKLKKPSLNQGGSLQTFCHPHIMQYSTHWGKIPNIHTV